jgi:ferredoxin
MTCVIAEPCMDVMDQACVRVCPVACIHWDAGKARKLSIDPQECIDCGACEPACPVETISHEYDLPARWVLYIDIDAPWVIALDSRVEILLRCSIPFCDRVL